MTGIRAVLFDVDGTLYHQPVLRACMAAEIALDPLRSASPGRTVRIARILRAYRAAHERLRHSATGVEPLPRLQIADAARRTGAPEREVSAVVDEWMCRRPLKYLPWCRRRGLLSLLSELRGSGVRLGVLSDYPARDKLLSLGVADFFSPVFCTSDPEINALKPHPRGFWRACEFWKLPPEEVLYVGDRAEVDARGADAAGIRCAIVQRGRHDQSGAEARHIRVRRLGDLGALAVC